MRRYEKVLCKKEFRFQKAGVALYKELSAFAKETSVRHILPDTPSTFMKKPGSPRISAAQLPIPYTYPDGDRLPYLPEL